jgi:hypothetical protein
MHFFDIQLKLKSNGAYYTFKDWRLISYANIHLIMARINSEAKVVVILEILGANIKHLLSTLQQSSLCERNTSPL